MILYKQNHACLLWLRMIVLLFIHVVRINGSSFFVAGLFIWLFQFVCSFTCWEALGPLQFGALIIQLGWTLGHTCLCGQTPLLLSGKASEWTGWIIWWVYILNFYEISKLFFAVVVPFCIPTSNIRSFICSASPPGRGSLFSSSCFSNDGVASHCFSLEFSND